ARGLAMLLGVGLAACAAKAPEPTPRPAGQARLSDEEQAELLALRRQQSDAPPAAEPTTSPCSNADPACDPGSQGCPCNPGQQCDGTMVCERAECVDRAGKGMASWRPPALTSQEIRVGLDTIQDRLRDCECAHQGEAAGLRVDFAISGELGRIFEIEVVGDAMSEELRQCVSTATQLASFETFQHTCQWAYFKPRLTSSCG